MKTKDIHNITLNAAGTKAGEKIRVGLVLIRNMGYGQRGIGANATNLRQAVETMQAGLTDRQKDHLERVRLERTGVKYDADQGAIAEEHAETVGDLVDALNLSDFTCILTADPEN